MAMIGPIIPLYLSATGGGGTVSLSGTAAGSATASASLVRSVSVGGSSAGAGSATGDADRLAGLAGAAAGTATVTGDLTVTAAGVVSLSGTASGIATATATLIVGRLIAGQADGSSTATLAWPRTSQPGGFVPEWAVRKFWKRVREQARTRVRKPKRPKRQGARIRYAEQVADEAKQVAREIERQSGGVNLSPLPGLLYDMLLININAIEMRLSQAEAAMMAAEAERRIRQDDEEILAMLLAETF